MAAVALFVHDELNDMDILGELVQCEIECQRAKIKETSTTEGRLIYLTQEQIWRVDQWKGSQGYIREEHTVYIEDSSTVEECTCKAWIYNKKCYDAVKTGVKKAADGKTETASAEAACAETEYKKKKLLEEIQAFKKQTAVSTYPFSDLYIYIPCNIDKPVDYANAKNRTIPLIAEKYINQLNLVSAYEFDNSLTKNIKRSFLDTVEIICETDEFENRSELGRQIVNIYITWHSNTNLAVITVAVPMISVSVTHLLDQMARGEIIINDSGRNLVRTNIYDWLKNTYSLSHIGTPRAYVNLSKKPEEDLEILYLLATEAIGNKIYSNISGQGFKEAAKLNIAQYEYSDIYAAETCVVQVFKEFSDTYEMRLMRQILTIFSIELILFQDAAVSRVNRKVASALEKQKHSDRDAINLIEKLSMEFAKTIVFWDLRNFRYETTQGVADAIARAFKIREQMDVYKENKEFLEHLITIHSASASERENRILNNTLLFLTVCQVAPVFYAIALSLLKGEVDTSRLLAACISASTFILILGVLKLIVRRRG